MKSTTMKRLASLEGLIVKQITASTDPLDYSIFSDDDLDTLESFAERVSAWPGDDWFERVLSPKEQNVFARLMAKAGITD